MPQLTTAPNNNQVRHSADGVWTLDGQDLHLDIPRLLQVTGLADTQENRNLAIDLATDMARQFLPNTILIITE